jgi:hypothetical protein
MVLRLDSHTETTLRRLAEQRGQTETDVVRDAIGRLAEDKPELSAFDRLRPFIGCSDSGGRQLSERTGERFRALVEEKHRARRLD